MADRTGRQATREPRWDLPYTGFVSFLRSPTCGDLDTLDADIAVLGAPSDEGSPWKPGARFAPRKIRELSIQFAGRGTVDGLSYEELREALVAIARHAEVVGFDLVEVNPMLDVASENTSLVAAQLIMEFLGRVVEPPRYRGRRHPPTRPTRRR